MHVLIKSDHAISSIADNHKINAPFSEVIFQPFFGTQITLAITNLVFFNLTFQRISESIK